MNIKQKIQLEMWKHGLSTQDVVEPVVAPVIAGLLIAGVSVIVQKETGLILYECLRGK